MLTDIRSVELLSSHSKIPALYASHLKAESSDPNHRIRIIRSQRLRAVNRYRNPETQQLEPNTRDPKPERPETQNPTPKTRNPKCKQAMETLEEESEEGGEVLREPSHHSENSQPRTSRRYFPKPESRNLNPAAPNLKPESRNSNPAAPDPKPESRNSNPQPHTRDSNPESLNPNPESRMPKFETRIQESKPRNPEPQSRYLNPETRIPKSESRNPEPASRVDEVDTVHRDWYIIAEQPAPEPHLAHPEGCDALSIVPVTVPRVSRSCEHFPDGFDLHLLQCCAL